MIHLPNDTQHLVNVGSNGSGKTVAGLWHLSLRDFTSKPWVIVDQKRDALIVAIGMIEIRPGDVPKKPGLYVTHPLPTDEDDAAMESALWKIWARENIGLFFDEGLMFAKSKALNSIYTQGRSKHIPVITNSQRPVFLSRFAFSEASFFQVFRLNDVRDVDTVRTMLPSLPRRYTLPKFHSYYYDSPDNQLTLFGPVPGPDQVLEAFHAKLMPARKVKVFL